MIANTFRASAIFTAAPSTTPLSVTYHDLSNTKLFQINKIIKILSVSYKLRIDTDNKGIIHLKSTSCNSYQSDSKSYAENPQILFTFLLNGDANCYTIHHNTENQCLYQINGGSSDKIIFTFDGLADNVIRQHISSLAIVFAIST